MIGNLHRPEWGWLAKVWMTQGAGRAWNRLEMSSLTDPEMAVGQGLPGTVHRNTLPGLSMGSLQVGHFGLPHSMVSKSKQPKSPKQKLYHLW